MTARRRLLLAAGVSLIVVIAGVIAHAIRNLNDGNGHEIDQWSLVGARSDQTRAVVLVRADQQLAPCEFSTGRARLVGDHVEVVVERRQEGCGGAQPAYAKIPQVLALAVPGLAHLEGQSIGGPGYSGTSVAYPSLRGTHTVPSIEGLGPVVARSLAESNGFRLDAPGSLVYVRSQAPRAGSVVRRAQRRLHAR